MRELASCDAVPRGLQASQAPGRYQLGRDPHNRYFAWANGPQAIKPLAFAPQETLWNVQRDEHGKLAFEAVMPDPPRQAIIGVRACDLAALALQDAHFLRDGRRDAHYAQRRERQFLVAVQCAEPAATCFCASTGDGPTPTAGY
ncbi:MAG: sulfite reductase subunit A, partial [Hydrogenophilales bacterium 17-62-8]